MLTALIVIALVSLLVIQLFITFNKKLKTEGLGSCLNYMAEISAECSYRLVCLAFGSLIGVSLVNYFAAWNALHVFVWVVAVVLLLALYMYAFLVFRSVTYRPRQVNKLSTKAKYYLIKYNILAIYLIVLLNALPFIVR